MIVDNSTKKYFKEKAKKSNLIIPDNFEEILNKYSKVVENFGYELEFGKKRGLSLYKLGANAGCFKKSSIVASPEWAIQLVLYNSEEVNNAFMITIGHELTHKECDICPLKHGPQFVKFIAYVNELHSDFGASQKMANSNRQKLLDSMEYKKAHKIKITGNDESDPSHPTWTQRIYYATHYDFDNNLIQQIAKDTGCKNQKIIDKVCEHYQEIKLSPPPEKECE